jgi:hypothetical protein
MRDFNYNNPFANPSANELHEMAHPIKNDSNQWNIMPNQMQNIATNCRVSGPQS